MIMQEGHISSPPGHEAVPQRLEEQLRQFDLWAVSADRSEDGWPGYFPQWPEMVHEAEQVMADGYQSDHALSLLGRCWALSEEDETCADWARAHLQDDRIQALVRRLAGDADASTRWQAYDVLGDLLVLDDGARASLENGLTDEEPYARRRAFLALLRHPETDVTPYILQMLTDTDVFNQSAARSAAPVSA